MLRFSATLILTIAGVISATLTVRFMMMQGANSEMDMLLNIGMGLVLAIAEVVFAAILVHLYNINRYFLSVLFLFITGPLVVTSILASNLQLLDAQSKTEHRAMVNDSGYRALLEMQQNYSSQINSIKSHPFYNEHNPQNKKRFDEQISALLVRQEKVSQQIANFNPASLESGNGFHVMGEWLGMSANQFKQYVFFAASVLLEAVMLLCTLFLTVTSANTGKSISGGPSNRPRKGIFRKLFSSFKLPSIVSPSANQPSGVRALNIQENNGGVNRNIPEYPVQEYPTLANHPLNFKLGNYFQNKNKALSVNLGAFPHLIVAGGSGSGKSTLLKALVTQIVERDPSEVKFLPIDLKQGATLFRFKHVPHLERTMASNNETAIQHLNWLIDEIRRRQDFLTSHECEDIVEYSKEFGKLPFNYLVAIFEEIALLMQADKTVADKLATVTAVGRSAGVHAILCTQYPKAEILNTRITANCLGRICFAMDKESQSRVVLDETGAEKLNGEGHALFKHKRHLIEIQTPLYSKEEIQAVVDTAIEKYGRNIPQSNIIPFPKNIPDKHVNIPESLGNENIPDRNIPMVELAKRLHQEGKKQVEIAKILGVPQGTVSKLLRKRA